MASPKASGRMIRTSISESDKFASLSPMAAVLFCMLIPHYNTHGKLFAGPGHIKDLVCPHVPYFSYDNLPEYLQEISDKTSVKWFKSAGKMWLHSLHHLSEHQELRADKMGKDSLPAYESSGSSPGVVRDLPLRAEGLKVEGFKEEERKEPLSSPVEELAPPPTPAAEEKAVMTERFSIFEFRNAYHQASGELLPGGLINAAQQLCMRHPRDKLEAAFAIMAESGGKTFRYLRTVLEGKTKNTADAGVLAVLAANKAVVEEFSGVDPGRLRFAMVFHWLAEKYPLKGIPRSLSLSFLADYFEALSGCDLDDVEAGARYHFNHGSKFFPQAPPALRESIQAVVAVKLRKSYQAGVEAEQAEPDDPAELLRYYQETIAGMERLGLDTTGWYVDESGERPQLVTGV